jgi:transposase
LDWQVIVRLVAHRQRRYRRECGCRVPATAMAPGPPKAIGEGPIHKRVHRDAADGAVRRGAEHELAGDGAFPAGRGHLARHLGRDVRAGRGAARAAGGGGHGAVAGSWHLHADETTWRVFAPREGDGPAKWWLWVFLGPDTVCFVMDPTRSGAVLARHAGIDEETGQLTDDGDGGPRRLVVSSDFYKVYESAGKKADGLVNLFCWAHVRRHFVRAGDANPAQLNYWTRAWLERIRDLYAAHDELMTAWGGAAAPAPRDKAAAAAPLDDAYAAWDTALAAIDQARKKQMAAPRAAGACEEGARDLGPRMGRPCRAL